LIKPSDKKQEFSGHKWT